MDFLVTPIVVAIIFGTIYKLFVLIICRKERIMMLEQRLKTPPPYCGGEEPHGLPPVPQASDRWMSNFNALKWGALICGLGFGILFGCIVCVWLYGARDLSFSYGVPSMIMGASVLLFGGLGLIAAYLVGNRRES